MSRLYKRGQYWHFDVSVDGQRIRKSTGATNKALALKIMQEVEARMTLGKFDIKSDTCNISNLFDSFIGHSRIHHATSTTQRYLYAIRNFQIFLAVNQPKIKKVSQLEPQTFEDYKQFRMTINFKDIDLPEGYKDSNNYSVGRSKTVNFEIKTLRSIFNYGIAMGMFSINPARGVKRIKGGDSKPPRFLSMGECRILLENAGADYPAIFILLNTGLRLGELMYLQWMDIEFGRKVLIVQGKPGWRPKSCEREIPLNTGMLVILKSIQPKKPSRNAYILPGKNRETMGRMLRKRMVQIARQVGIEDFTKIHSLRHTFASHLVMQGVDLPTVRKLLGHASIETTMIYAHLAPDHLVAAVGKLNFPVSQNWHNP